MNNTNLTQADFSTDSIPAAPAGILELGDDFVDDLCGGGFFGDIVSAAKQIGSAVWTTAHTVGAFVLGKVIPSLPRLPPLIFCVTGVVPCKLQP